MRETKIKSQKTVVKKPKRCFFCENKAVLDYKDVENLRRFISERGKIIPRSRSGICAKHQRKLAREIKKARYIALLPFVTRV